KTVEGIAIGIDTDGALLLQDKGGSIIKIISGEIELYTAT
ncbi:MAG TPA: hypothetical protein DHU69_03720, partial [Deltaproteobacteria bacterium]|nr:hypothetical protein [Deltaproteobacteria bacterium]